MIKISYSPRDGVELSGSLAELQDLSTTIHTMLDSQVDDLVIDADNKFDPLPYEIRLSALNIKKRQGPVRVSVTADKILLVEGAADNLDGFTSFIDILLNGEFPNHSHYEYYEGNRWIASDSIPLVLSVQNH